MKEIIIGGRPLKIKDYHCALPGQEPLPRDDARLWLYIHLTDRCNARCPFCVNPAGDSRQTPFSPDRLRDTLRRVAPYVYGVSLTGGEPMLSPELVDDAARAVCGVFPDEVELDLVTNGTNLSMLPRLRMLDRFESVHISRHGTGDEENARLMGFAAPSLREIANVVSALTDPAKIVLNCVLQNPGIHDRPGLCQYLEAAAGAGVRNVSFVGFFMANAYCREHYVSPAKIDVSGDARFRLWTHFHDYDFCSCRGGDYLSRHGPIRFYYRCPGPASPDYCRQLVYTADNRLTAGFGGPELSL